jgi:hypothetical protein
VPWVKKKRGGEDPLFRGFLFFALDVEIAGTDCSWLKGLVSTVVCCKWFLV